MVFQMASSGLQSSVKEDVQCPDFLEEVTSVLKPEFPSGKEGWPEWGDSLGSQREERREEMS